VTPRSYRVIGFKINEFGRLVKCEVHRDVFAGDNSACSAKFFMQANGWKVAIRPTAGAWTEELEVPT